MTYRNRIIKYLEGINIHEEKIWGTWTFDVIVSVDEICKEKTKPDFINCIKELIDSNYFYPKFFIDFNSDYSKFRKSEYVNFKKYLDNQK